MRGIDLRRFTFDWDLTFAALAMNADGTIYHRYGGRDWRGSDVWLSNASFQAFLRAGLAAHAGGAATTADQEAEPPLILEELPAYKSRDKGECIHCHMVFPSLREEAQREKTWELEDIWVYPPPERIGIDLDRDNQRRVTSVAKGSPAARAGVQIGDQLVSLAGDMIAGASDVSATLQNISPGGGDQKLAIERDGERLQLTLPLEEGWRQGTPKSFSWRPSKWTLTPAPGFGGKILGEEELTTLGLQPDQFAMRVDYIVTWGNGRRLGKNAIAAGLREGMIVLGTSEKRDFLDGHHFHAWWRLTRKPGDMVELVTWRDGAEHTLPIEAIR